MDWTRTMVYEPWEIEFPFPGSFTSTFLDETTFSRAGVWTMAATVGKVSREAS